MAQVVLVRHGHPLQEGEDPTRWPLSPEGRRAAADLARLDVWRPVERIVTSPEPKAQETAAMLANARDLPLAILDDLREVRRPYEASGYEDKIRLFLKGEPPAGWEARGEAEARIGRAMRTITKDRGAVGAVSHALLLALFVAQVMGAPPTFWLHHSIGFAHYALYDDDEGAFIHGFRGGGRGV